MIIEFHGAWDDFLIHIIFSSLSYITRDWLSFFRLDVAYFLPRDTNLDKIEAFKVALYHLCIIYANGQRGRVTVKRHRDFSKLLIQ